MSLTAFRRCRFQLGKNLNVQSLTMKRSLPPAGGNVSPPQVKRKIESTTTSKAVASFFKPVSQRELEILTWRIINNSLIVGKYSDPSSPPSSFDKPVRVAAFDLDDTVITPKPGSKWDRSATSWNWWDSIVPGRLKQLHDEGYLVVLISNQGNISLKDNAKVLQKDTLSLRNFKNQVTAILHQLDFPITIYAATAQDRYRKPRIGMWEEMKEDYDLEVEGSIDMANSFYVGDAGGREKTEKRRKDHSISDRDLATNIGIGFHTPDEFFLQATPEPFVHTFEPKQVLATNTGNVDGLKVVFEKKNPQELVVSCGSPGAGKSSFYWNILQPLGYKRVKQDILKTRDKCIKVAREMLKEGSSVAIDNTNADVQTRAYWIAVAQDFDVPIRCIHFTASPRLCEHNDAVRAHNKIMNPENRSILPSIAFRSFVQRFEPPTLDEGFQDITKVKFKFEGTDEEREIWSKYWVSTFST